MIRKLKTLDDLPVDGRIVLMRVDFNVPVGDNGIVDKFEDYRLQAAIPTIEELQQRRCKVILLTHRGRSGNSEGDLGLEPVRQRLEDLLRDDVRSLQHWQGSELDAVVSGLALGSVALLPNVRLDEREVAGSDKFAQELSNIGDVFVNEAFSVSHRNHTSIALVPKLMPSCAGRRTVLEYETLSALNDKPDRPYVAIVSGAKVQTKLKLLSELLQIVDRLCVGGRIANAFLAQLGKCSADQCSSEDLAQAEQLLLKAGDKIVLPVDVVVGPGFKEPAQAAVVPVEDIPTTADGIWDVGPATVNAYLNICRNAKTVLWNGPLGKFEDSAYAAGTRMFAKGLAGLSAKRIVGGGDTVTALEWLHLATKFDHVSVGGGAMLSLLEGRRMPGLEPLFV